jgi:hypothetical protein
MPSFDAGGSDGYPFAIGRHRGALDPQPVTPQPRPELVDMCATGDTRR